jgi:hypothetical protein
VLSVDAFDSSLRHLPRGVAYERACHPASAAASHDKDLLDLAVLLKELAQVILTAAGWTTCKIEIWGY